MGNCIVEDVCVRISVAIVVVNLSNSKQNFKILSRTTGTRNMPFREVVIDGSGGFEVSNLISTSHAHVVCDCDGFAHSQAELLCWAHKM